MKDPLCPHCQIPSSEHKANVCLNSWIASQCPPANDILYEARLDNRFNYGHWFNKERHTCWGPENRVFTDWEHAGPLLVEMMSGVGIVAFMSSSMEQRYAVEFYDSERGLIFREEGDGFSLCVCRGYLIWRANKEIAE